MSTTPKTCGFAMVEAIIILLIVGILAVLAMNSLQLVQAKSRDTTRRADMDAIAHTIEGCFADKDRCNDTYPSLNQLTDTFDGGFVATQLKGLSTDALHDSSAGIIQAEPASAATQYQYVTAPDQCTGTIGDTPCRGFTLRAYQETSTEQSYIKDSLYK